VGAFCCLYLVQINRVLIGDTSVDHNIEEEVSFAESGGADEAILEVRCQDSPSFMTTPPTLQCFRHSCTLRQGGVSPPRTPHGAQSAYDYSYNDGGTESTSGADAVIGNVRQRLGQRKQRSEFTRAILLD